MSSDAVPECCHREPFREGVNCQWDAAKSGSAANDVTR